MSIKDFKTLCPSVLNNTYQKKEIDDYVFEDIVPPKDSYSRHLIKEREEWYSKFYKKSEDFNLVFFDPDNGLQVNSIPPGRSLSCKYVFLNEIQKVVKRKQNVLIYQHRNRQNYDNQLKTKKDLLSNISPPSNILVMSKKLGQETVYKLHPMRYFLESYHTT